MGIKCPQCKSKNIERTEPKTYKVIPEKGKFRFEGPVDEKLEEQTSATQKEGYLLARMMSFRCKKCGHLFPTIFPSRR